MDTTEIQQLSEQELKSAIVAAWKKHSELAKQDLAPMLYWLREKLGAQGARNDLKQDKHRGWEIWVTEHLDISRATADRWCAWYAKEAGLVPAEPTSTHVSGSDEALWIDVLDTHKGKLQITFTNVWVPKAMHEQYHKALTTLQKKFGLDKKEALVRGVIYAASVVNTKGLRQLPVPGIKGKTRVSSATRRGVRPINGRAKNVSRLSAAARSQAKTSGTNSKSGGTGSSKAMRAAAGR